MKKYRNWLYRNSFYSYLTLLCFVFIAPPAFSEEKKVLSFGVVPQQSAGKLARNWIPVLDYIGNKTGYIINFETAPDIPEFEKRLQKGMYDLAYMNPYHYAAYSKTPGYRAFAKQKGEKLVAILVTKKNSEIRSIQDLRGKILAFPSPAAFAASILTREFLLKNGIDITPKYVGSHDSVYRTVANGIYPAGGGITRTLENMEKDVKEQLHIIWTSKPYTPHAFASLPSVSDSVVNKILNAMKLMNNDPEALNLLKSIEFTGFEQARDLEWNDIRALRIKELESKGK
ncbi:MAG TPA: phosphate/phosphite/phosphonate ABC transporter substrate-binding protein [Thermodesulfovibrionales bacterium]|nr:phosphate/phosphite/phosphonate ABC transporter substrate-binding protein [Thermodesulfovibrionales bacterium]